MSRISVTSRVCAAAGAVAVAIACAAPAVATTAPVTAHTTVSARAHVTPYQNARNAWKNGANASAAVQGEYWHRAEVRLKAAPHNRFAEQRRELRALISYPNTSLTPAQIHRVRHLTRELDSFFRTPGLYF